MRNVSLPEWRDRLNRTQDSPNTNEFFYMEGRARLVHHKEKDEAVYACIDGKLILRYQGNQRWTVSYQDTTPQHDASLCFKIPEGFKIAGSRNGDLVARTVEPVAGTFLFTQKGDLTV